jgi:hypothetical protein
MKLAAPLLLVATLVLGAPVAMASAPVEGKDYFLVEPALPPADPSKIVVTEILLVSVSALLSVREAVRGLDGRPSVRGQD